MSVLLKGWSKKHQGVIRRLMRLADDYVSSWARLIEALAAWERSKPWKSRGMASFAHVLRLLQMPVSVDEYESGKRFLRKFGRDKAEEIGFHAVRFCCRIPLNDPRKVQYLREVESFVRRTGRKPSASKARELLKRIAPERVLAGAVKTPGTLEQRLRRRVAELEEECARLLKENKELRREVARLRRALAGV